MKNFDQLRKAIKEKKTLVWNDPDKQKDTDYTITTVEDVSDFDDDYRDVPFGIQYDGGHSFAEVFLSEISFK